jgi:hypothetical protein
MFIEAFKSLHRLTLQLGQLCVLSDSGFITLVPQLEHSWLVQFGFTAITFSPAFAALTVSIEINCPQPASFTLLASRDLASPLIFSFSTAITSYFLTANLCRH